MTCKYFMISNVCIIVNNSHHLDMNYLLTYYFIDSPLYQRRKCRHMYIYIYMFLFFRTPMCLIGFQDPRNHYIWSNEETIVHMHDLNQPCSIYSVQRCKSGKSFASSLQYNLSDQPQFDVCFFINQILFSYQMLCFRDLLVGVWFFLCNRWTCLYNAFQPSVALSGSSVHNLAVFDFEPSFEWNK